MAETTDMAYDLATERKAHLEVEPFLVHGSEVCIACRAFAEIEQLQTVTESLVKAHVREFGPSLEAYQHMSDLEKALLTAAQAVGYQSLKEIWQDDTGKPYVEFTG